MSDVSSGASSSSSEDERSQASTSASRVGSNLNGKPTNRAAPTDRHLTNYQSLFFDLISWTNPRNSAVAYASIVSAILAIHFFDVLRWSLKLTWMVLGVTVAAELAGKTVLNSGLTSQLRPSTYYTIPCETLDIVIGDVHELINFFVVEAQRILFVENVAASASVLVAAFMSYFLVKVMPLWGLALLGVTATFFVPLIYTSNQELIDHHIKQASDLLGAQTAQLRQIAQKHTAQATELTKQYMGDYTSRAQSMIRSQAGAPLKSQPSGKKYTDADFPAAPKDFKAASKAEEEPLIAT